MAVQQNVKKSSGKDLTASSGKGLDKLKWFVVVLVVLALIAANMYYASVPAAIRVGVFIVVVAALLFFAKTTAQGKVAWGFIKSARTEMRKVVWPTRKETLHTTMIIVVVVLIAALILWLFDGLFMYFVRAILSI